MIEGTFVADEYVYLIDGNCGFGECANVNNDTVFDWANYDKDGFGRMCVIAASFKAEKYASDGSFYSSSNRGSEGSFVRTDDKFIMDGNKVIMTNRRGEKLDEQKTGKKLMTDDGRLKIIRQFPNGGELTVIYKKQR
jgi:hypothetical protein